MIYALCYIFNSMSSSSAFFTTCNLMLFAVTLLLPLWSHLCSLNDNKARKTNICSPGINPCLALVVPCDNMFMYKCWRRARTCSAPCIANGAAWCFARSLVSSDIASFQALPALNIAIPWGLHSYLSPYSDLFCQLVEKMPHNNTQPTYSVPLLSSKSTSMDKTRHWGSREKSSVNLFFAWCLLSQPCLSLPISFSSSPSLVHFFFFPDVRCDQCSFSIFCLRSRWISQQLQLRSLKAVCENTNSVAFP